MGIATRKLQRGKTVGADIPYLTEGLITAKILLQRTPNSLERLEYINQTTLKIVTADSFYAEGELVHFNFENDEVQTIVYTGYTMWPSEVWFEKQRSRQQVQLQ